MNVGYSYYEVIVSCGHLGNRRSVDITRYFQAEDIVECYQSGFYMPRSKKNNTCIKQIRVINYNEYISGKEKEKDNPYLQVHKGKRTSIAI